MEDKDELFTNDSAAEETPVTEETGTEETPVTEETAPETQSAPRRQAVHYRQKEKRT